MDGVNLISDSERGVEYILCLTGKQFLINVIKGCFHDKQLNIGM